LLELAKKPLKNLGQFILIALRICLPLADEAKNMITETKELMSMINNSKPLYDIALSKQQKLKDKWEVLEQLLQTTMEVAEKSR
jgi:hypothetical protein